MPFKNEITGGDFLVRNQIQSPNYVAGTSGWRIARDGTVEFNSGTFRGSVQIGTSPGQHIVLANPSTGDAVDVYNASNQLVGFIDNQGRIQTQTSTGPFSRLVNGTVVLGDTRSSSGFPGEMTFTFGSPDRLTLFSGHEPGDGDTTLILISDSGNAGVGYVEANQSGALGALMQTGTNSSVGNLRHYGEYTVTTDSTGTFTLTHGCGFTPTGSMFTVATLGDPIIGYMFSYTSTTATGRAFNGGSGANTASATFNIHAEFVR